MHYAGADGKHASMGAKTFTLDEGKFADDFHIFELEWDAGRMTWLVDAEPFASASISDAVHSEFHEEFFILLNIAVGGKHAGRPDATTPFPQQMLVDWVRVHQKNQ
jgi:beta-glucanase (GH16 family)